MSKFPWTGPRRHQYRRQQVFSRQDGLPGTRNQRGPARPSAWSIPSPVGAKKDGYFKSETDAENFRLELAHLMITQKACFNSPVWFNVGVSETRATADLRPQGQPRRQARVGRGFPRARPQCSACFIVSVKDSLESILDLAKTEGMLFKWGSGTGSNSRPARGRCRSVGRRARLRAALFYEGLRRLRRRHQVRRQNAPRRQNGDPQRRPPRHRKVHLVQGQEEKKAYTLVEAGYDSSIDGDAYSSIFFQNANNSVRATDDFMEAAACDGDWWTKGVATGQPVKRYKAREILRAIAEATHQCGDPGMQFDTTVKPLAPVQEHGPHQRLQPLLEYMFLDDSACNLSSLNLMKFVGPNGQFDVEAFRHAVDTMIVAQEIIVDNASYPTQRIGENSHAFRPLGLGSPTSARC